jgi:hypothetical protein
MAERTCLIIHFTNVSESRYKNGELVRIGRREIVVLLCVVRSGGAEENHSSRADALWGVERSHGLFLYVRSVQNTQRLATLMEMLLFLVQISP